MQLNLLCRFTSICCLLAILRAVASDVVAYETKQIHFDNGYWQHAQQQQQQQPNDQQNNDDGDDVDDKMDGNNREDRLRMLMPARVTPATTTTTRITTTTHSQGQKLLKQQQQQNQKQQRQQHVSNNIKAQSWLEYKDNGEFNIVFNSLQTGDADTDAEAGNDGVDDDGGGSGDWGDNDIGAVAVATGAINIDNDEGGGGGSDGAFAGDGMADFGQFYTNATTTFDNIINNDNNNNNNNINNNNIDVDGVDLNAVAYDDESLRVSEHIGNYDGVDGDFDGIGDGVGVGVGVDGDGFVGDMNVDATGVVDDVAVAPTAYDDDDVMRRLLSISRIVKRETKRRDNAMMTFYNVGVLMASHLDSPFDLERCGPAVDLALDVINQEFLKPHNITLRKVQASYPSCSGAKAPGLAADMHFKDDVIAFIGPACAFALEPVARLAAYWNSPIITGMGDQPPSEGELTVTSGILGKIHKWKNESTGMFKDKSKYPTLTRMSYCQCRLKLVFASVFRQFNWKHVALLVDRSDLFSLTVGKNLEYGLRQEGLLSFVRELNGNEEEIYENYLKDASMYARVVILSVRGILVRKFMLAAYALGMTHGDWVFLDVEIFQSSYWGDHGWEMGDVDDSRARKAYEALLRVSLLQPTNTRYHGFSENVREQATRNYNYTFSEGEDVNFFIGAFYDGVYLLGMALNETLSEGEDIRDGMAITRRMWNRDFHGITGHVRIDDNGDRDADYSILDLDPITGKFAVVAHYYGLHRNFSAVQGKKIHWPGGREGPPLDVPRCGFLGNSPECHGNELIIMYSTFAFAIFVGFSFMVVYLFCKQMKLNNELNNMSWRVRPDEVLLEVGRLYGSKVGLQKLNAENFSLQQYGIHSGRASIASCTSLPPTQVFTTIGIFKGERVAIKKIHKKKVEVTSTLLWEIKQARDVSHENTVRFVGACIDLPRPTVLILTEYCPKGSLKDVLENEAIQLDWNFRMSLIHDIVKGMAYLHNSDVQVHGKLRSCNCLIDGRFVLKISDFGLRTLTTPSEFVKDQAYFNKFLWVSPELLPLTVLPGNPATQKGDVYSFAIILEEIVVRGGPYEMAKQFMDVKTILNRVESHEAPPFRPCVGQRDCPPDVLDLMEKCWADNPDDRPAFLTIRSIVRMIMKGFCENLMDDLLRRMEQYANNLESLVEEKTEQLSMEKRRTEELLFQVLPRPVAAQLLAGEMVQPEQFECVTIYFSDIVGFTALCAQSGPMEVVDFLNDLYSTFDRIIGFYDVYKVETIGDAYMVVSGLPERNGDDHAREIGLMALAILDAVKSFTIKHKPDYKLKIRIGIHAGPVCAGVVGQKMPHFCLFGDTVNTASRMESAGLPLKIHVSSAAKQIFDKFGTFELELRGEVELKGKGTVITYWLIGCTEPDPRPPTPQKNNNDDLPFPILFPSIGK